jgi:hypothetical protein
MLSIMELRASICFSRPAAPAVRVDIVLSTHADFDHNAVDAPDALMVLGRLVGQFKLGDVEITGLADKHQCESTPCPPKNELNGCHHRVYYFGNHIENK